METFKVRSGSEPQVGEQIEMVDGPHGNYINYRVVDVSAQRTVTVREWRWWDWFVSAWLYRLVVAKG